MERTKWEYRRIALVGDLDACADELGEDGWEIFEVLGHAKHPEQEDVTCPVVWMKRPKQLINVVTEIDGKAVARQLVDIANKGSGLKVIK